MRLTPLRVVLSSVAVVALTGAAAAQSDCGAYDLVAPYMEAYTAGAPFTASADAVEAIATMRDANCQQAAVVAALKADYGEVVGYKAGATSPGAQKSLGLDAPVLGVLLSEMMLENGAAVAIDDAGRMVMELDLLARVGDAAINTATTREEALAALDAFMPFIELADLMTPAGAPTSGPLLQAINVGARYGVAGAPVPTDGMTVESLAAATGTMTLNGAPVAEGSATALLGHPLDAVLWIVRNANERGLELKAGDVLSLGSFAPLKPAEPGALEARYTGLSAEPVTVSATLR